MYMNGMMIYKKTKTKKTQRYSYSKQEELSACVDDLICHKTTVNECVNNLTDMLHDIFDETCKRETRIGTNCSVHTNKHVIAHGHKPWFNNVLNCIIGISTLFGNSITSVAI